jgi:hypothetical protein
MNDIATAARRILKQPAFLIVCGILLLAAVTLNASVHYMQLYFRKEPVAQPRDFHELPPIMGHWMQISVDERLDKEVQDYLGTDKYVYRDYIQVDHCGADLLTYLERVPKDDKAEPAALDDAATARVAAVTANFNNASFDQRVKMIRDALSKNAVDRRKLVSAMEATHPGSAINIGLTYYTGWADTVAHIPDRCYIADGYEPSSYEIKSWPVGLDRLGKPVSLRVRFISFQDSTGSNRVSKCVGYLFHTNGLYEEDPLRVRQVLQNLVQRYGYYAKIEMMTVGEDKTASEQAMRDFLSAARPDIETCFPDWEKVIHPGT